MCDSCESLLSDVLGLGSTMIIQRGELLDAIHLLRKISIYEHLIREPFVKCKAWIMDCVNGFIYLNDIKSTWVETQPNDQKMFFLFLVTHTIFMCWNWSHLSHFIDHRFFHGLLIVLKSFTEVSNWSMWLNMRDCQHDDDYLTKI